MRKGNLIVFSPGFRQVWKFRFDAAALLILVAALVLAPIAMRFAGYVEILLTNGNNDEHVRRVVENGMLSIENRGAKFEIQQLTEQARDLEEKASQIAEDLEE